MSGALSCYTDLQLCSDAGRFMFWSVWAWVRCISKFVVRLSSIADFSIDEMCYFLTLIILMGHDVRGSIKYCRSHKKFYRTRIYTWVTKHDHYVHLMKVILLGNKVHLSDRIHVTKGCGRSKEVLSTCVSYICFTVFHPTENLTVIELWNSRVNWLFGCT